MNIPFIAFFNLYSTFKCEKIKWKNYEIVQETEKSMREYPHFKTAESLFYAEVNSKNNISNTSFPHHNTLKPISPLLFYSYYNLKDKKGKQILFLFLEFLKDSSIRSTSLGVETQGKHFFWQKDNR